jgi:prepilin-type N-terminal cleavage/methylation domain-containing protein
MKNRKDTKNLAESAGFTLIELLLSISLLAISIGISSDIIVTLVRTYTKAQVYNDTEQVVNFVFLKLQNDLKSSTSAAIPSGNTLVLSRRDGQTITYTVVAGTPPQLTRNSIPLMDTSSPVGNVEISCTGGFGACFTLLSNDPVTIQVNMNFSQAGGVGIFGSEVSLEDTFVVRGSY